MNCTKRKDFKLCTLYTIFMSKQYFNKIIYLRMTIVKEEEYTQITNV